MRAIHKEDLGYLAASFLNYVSKYMADKISYIMGSSDKLTKTLNVDI